MGKSNQVLILAGNGAVLNMPADYRETLSGQFFSSFSDMLAEDNDAIARYLFDNNGNFPGLYNVAYYKYPQTRWVRHVIFIAHNTRGIGSRSIPTDNFCSVKLETKFNFLEIGYLKDKSDYELADYLVKAVDIRPKISREVLGAQMEHLIGRIASLDIFQPTFIPRELIDYYKSLEVK